MWIFNSKQSLLHAEPITCSGNLNKAYTAKGRQLILCGQQLIFHVCPFHVVLALCGGVAIWKSAFVHFSLLCFCVCVRVLASVCECALSGAFVDKPVD